MGYESGIGKNTGYALVQEDEKMHSRLLEFLWIGQNNNNNNKHL